jgi:transcriptional repressor NF-X1
LKDECEKEDEPCTQPCQRERPNCGHACEQACHGDTPCPDSICQAVLDIKCRCGLKTKQVKCQQRMCEPTSQVVFENLAGELKEMLSCKSIDISSFNDAQLQKRKHELLCDEECFVNERNMTLAQALQIDFFGKPKVIYSDFLKNYGRDEPDFVLDIEKRFDEIIKELKGQTKSLRRAFHFPVMKYYERKFVHELAPYYGLETMSQDPEPNRSIDIYGTKDKATLPVQLLSESIDFKVKPTTMPRLTTMSQQLKAQPMKTNLKVLTPEQDFLKLSSAFSVLDDESNNFNEQTKSSNDKKIVDYFDVTD